MSLRCLGPSGCLLLFSLACSQTPSANPSKALIHIPRPTVNDTWEVPREILEPEPVQLAMPEDSFLTNPTFTTVDNDLYVSDMSGDQAGVIYRFDLLGTLIGTYARLGLGPGELGPPNRIFATDQIIYLSERAEPVIHRLTRDLKYLEQNRYQASSRVVFDRKPFLARWRYQRLDQEKGGGNLLAIHDKMSGEELTVLLPFEKMHYAIGMHGGAVYHGQTIYAVSANTLALDIVNTPTWQTHRMSLRDGYRIEEPQDWSAWADRNNARPSVEGLEAWLETFARPLDITLVKDHLVILYARGRQHFFDVHTRAGALISRNNQVNLPFPVINQTRIEAIYDAGDNQQFFASIDLEMALASILP